MVLNKYFKSKCFRVKSKCSLDFFSLRELMELATSTLKINLFIILISDFVGDIEFGMF